MKVYYIRTALVRCANCGVRTGGTETELDPDNHENVVEDPAIEPTYETTGKTAGSHCEVCGVALVEQTEIPKLTKPEEIPDDPTESDTGDSSGTNPDSGAINPPETNNISGSVPVYVSKIFLAGISKKIAAGKSIQLNASVLPESATDKGIKWTSSNTKYATVNSKEKVVTKKAGKGKKATVKIKIK